MKMRSKWLARRSLTQALSAIMKLIGREVKLRRLANGVKYNERRETKRSAARAGTASAVLAAVSKRASSGIGNHHRAVAFESPVGDNWRRAARMSWSWRERSLSKRGLGVKAKPRPMKRRRKTSSSRR